MGRYAVDWRTAPLRAGDVVVLGLNTYHMTARNVSGEARLSCDTRWCAPLWLWLLECTARLFRLLCICQTLLVQRVQSPADTLST